MLPDEGRREPCGRKRFGLTVGNESGHYIFRLWPQRLFPGYRGMP